MKIFVTCRLTTKVTKIAPHKNNPLYDSQLSLVAEHDTDYRCLKFALFHKILTAFSPVMVMFVCLAITVPCATPPSSC